MTPQFPVPYATGPLFPFALFDEGHTGVSLFMTLSGYLFTKLVGDHRVDFANFLWSRAVRLGPLLVVFLAAWWAIGWSRGHPMPAGDLIGGLIFPTWQPGAWSITIELHFYALFPLLILAVRRFGPVALLCALAIAIALRIDWWFAAGEVQRPAYWTIVGRIDQFLLGMFFASVKIRRPVLAAVSALSVLSFLIFWTRFDRMGGLYNWTGAPSTSALWIVIPTIEAFAYASLIALYDGSSVRLPAWLDRGLARIGEWSFSIYLLHFFPIILLREIFWTSVGSANNFFIALLCANIGFLAFLPVAALSYNYFEKAFLVYRRPYILEPILAVPSPSHLKVAGGG